MHKSRCDQKSKIVDRGEGSKLVDWGADPGPAKIHVVTRNIVQVLLQKLCIFVVKLQYALSQKIFHTRRVQMCVIRLST